MIIAITGTPGTGKSSAAKKLAEKTNFTLVGISAFAKKHSLIIGYDKKRKSEIVDVRKLKKEIALYIKARVKCRETRCAHRGKNKSNGGNAILEGHLSHFCKSGVCIVLRTNPEELRLRLEKRKWSKRKIEENIEAEKLDICLQEAVKLCGIKNVFEIDTSKKTAEKTAEEIGQIIRRKNPEKYAPGKINWI